MVLSSLRQFLCHILTPVLEMGDGDIFHAHQMIADDGDDPAWFPLWHFISRTQPQTPHAPIGGQRITIGWLHALHPRDCLDQFRFYAEELVHLAVVLDIPEIFRTTKRYAFPRVEALALFLARFKSPADLADLTRRYDRCESSISELVNELAEFLDERWSHLLDFDAQHILSPARLQEYAAAIFANGAPLDTILGFMDCTIRGICRPSRHQRPSYNGYKKKHAIKFQAIKLPNGLIGHLWGPIEGRRNDNALLAESHILEKCAQFAFRPGADQNTPIGQRWFQIFGDPAYGVSPLILSPYASANRTEEQKQWNTAMSKVRMSVEHGFGELTRQWPFLNVWWKHRVYSSPVGRYYRVCVLLTNALNCIRPNQTSQTFDCEPPYVEDYFHD